MIPEVVVSVAYGLVIAVALLPERPGVAAAAFVLSPLFGVAICVIREATT